jgi:succinyl-CoA synthetase beta subunit/citryl-CoA synthetase large subunit
MILLEHEGKKLLQMAGVNVPGAVLTSDLGSLTCDSQRLPAVVKAQTPFGKRLQQGGIRFAQTSGELKRAVSDLLGSKLMGFTVEQVLVEDKIIYDRELFVSLSYDSLRRLPSLLLSPEGGVGIEELAAVRPNAVWKMLINPRREVLPHHLIEWLSEKGLVGVELRDLSQILGSLIRQFFAWDALLMEINPLVFASDHKYYALDCHVEIDDDGLPRQRFEAILGRDPRNRKLGERRLTPFEDCARQIDDSDYRGVAGRLIEFPGNLGLLIGGGGASLTIFDAVLRHNGEPANYCEIGGNPTADKVARLTKLVVTQPRVVKLAVIMNVVNNTQADLVAEGVVRGIREAGKTPKEVVVMFRVPGSGEERCREILSANGIPFTDRSVTIDEAAFKAVEAVKSINATEVPK